MVGIDIFSGKKYEDICPSTHNMDVPHVKREDYQLTDISDDGYLSLMSDNGELREDLKIPDGDLGTQLRSDFDSGKELLVSFMSFTDNKFLKYPLKSSLESLIWYVNCWLVLQVTRRVKGPFYALLYTD